MASRVDVALVFPPIRTWDEPRNFPTGLGIVAAVIRQMGFSVAVVDAKGEKLTVFELQDRLRALAPRVVGIGGLVTTYRFVRNLSRWIRLALPDAKIMVGGSVGGSIPELMINSNPVDAVCIGEADETVKELLPALIDSSDLSAIRGKIGRAHV